MYRYILYELLDEICWFFYKNSADLSANYRYGHILKKLYNWVSRSWKHVLE